MVCVKQWFVAMVVGGTILLGPTSCVVAPVEAGYVASPPVVVIRHYHHHRHYHPYRYYRPYRYYYYWPYHPYRHYRHYYPYRGYRPYHPYDGWSPYGHRR